jgi:hypothetical protein
MSIPRPKQSTRNPSVSMLLALLLGSFALPAGADEDCVDFKWDVSKERILFAGAPADLTAGYDRASAPLIVPNRLYRLQLQTQDTVAFSVPPGKPLTGTQSFAGLATLKVAVPGSYRVAVDVPFWIDVAANGVLLRPTDYQGQHSCSPPHKIVVFDLAGAKPFTLQFSNAAMDKVLLTVTLAPPRKS